MNLNEWPLVYKIVHQRLMNKILSGLQAVELYIYMDDVIIFADSIRSHQIKLKKFFARIQAARLTLQPEKCLFLRREVTYLGHKVTEKGVSSDPLKTVAVREFPCPKNVKNIKEFLGLAGYYRRFVPQYANLSKPLTTLLKKIHRLSGEITKKKPFLL